MAKKAAKTESTTTKAEDLRLWWSDKPEGLKWKEVMPDVQKFLEGRGHTFNESSDYLQFRTQGIALGKLNKGKRTASGTTAGASAGTTAGGSFADFVTAVIDANVDIQQLTSALKIVADFGSSAPAHATRWEQLVQAVGEEKAQTVAQLFD